MNVGLRIALTGFLVFAAILILGLFLFKVLELEFDDTPKGNVFKMVFTYGMILGWLTMIIGGLIWIWTCE